MDVRGRLDRRQKLQTRQKLNLVKASTGPVKSSLTAHLSFLQDQFEAFSLMLSF
jgi:hypothetical protein